MCISVSQLVRNIGIAVFSGKQHSLAYQYLLVYVQQYSLTFDDETSLSVNIIRYTSHSDVISYEMLNVSFAVYFVDESLQCIGQREVFW